MKLNTCFGIAGLFVVVFAGCGGSDEPCAPAGRWSVTATALAGDDCDDAVETSDRIVTVANGVATITDPETGISHEGPLDASCHMGYVTAISTPDYVAAGSADWTFNGASLSGSVSGHATATADGSMCTAKQKLVGVRL